MGKREQGEAAECAAHTLAGITGDSRGLGGTPGRWQRGPPAQSGPSAASVAQARLASARGPPLGCREAGRGAHWAAGRDPGTAGSAGTQDARGGPGGARLAPSPSPAARARAAVTSRATRQPRAPPGRARVAAEHMGPRAGRARGGQDEEGRRGAAGEDVPRDPWHLPVDFLAQGMWSAPVTCGDPSRSALREKSRNCLAGPTV
ncbi:uncharacterized protein LOC108588705 [Callithrix jacchus]